MANERNPIKYADLISPDSSITDLIKQLDELSDAYTNALKNIKGEAIQLSAALGKVSGATEAGRQATKKAATEADKLEKAYRDLEFAESETAKKLAELKAITHEQNEINKLTVKLNKSAEGSYNKLSAQYSLNKIYLNSLTQEERENTEEGRKLVEQTKAIYEEMKRLQEATGKHQLNVGNYTEASDAIIAYGDRLKESLGLNNAFGNSILALGKGGEEAKNAFTAMADGAKSLGNTLLTLLTNPVFLGIAGIAGAGAAFKWWYDYNNGLIEATRLTKQFTDKSGEDLKNYRNKVQSIADTFNADFKDVLRSANSLTKQFGIDSDEALKLVQDGFVAGADVNGEYLDTLREYPAYFKEAGLSASEFVAIIAESNKEGIFSDKGVDAIKEANIRLREMTTATAAALDGIGISSKQVQADLQNGAKTTFEVMQDVSKRLNELPDSASQVGAAIADIFGGPGEDAGLQYIRTLKDISTNLNDVKGEAGELGKLQEEQLQSQLELQNALSGLFDATGGNFEAMTTKAKTFVNKGIAALIKSVISLLNYFREFYNDSLALRSAWESALFTIKTVIDTAKNAFSGLFDIVKASATAIKGVFTFDLDTVEKGLSDYGNAIKNFATNTVKDVKDNFNKGITNINKKLDPIKIPVDVDGSPTDAPQKVVTDAPKTDTKKDIEDAYKKNLDLTRKLQDAQLALEDDTWKQRRQKTRLNYERQIEDLQHQLATEKTLTAEDKTAIKDTIIALKQQEAKELLKIEEERQIKELEVQKEGLNLRLQAVQKGSQEERDLRLQLNEIERQQALKLNEQKAESERQGSNIITASYKQKAAEIADEYLQTQLSIFDKQQEFEQSEFDLLKNSEERKTRFRLQAEKARLQKILELNKQAGTQLSDIEIATIQNTIKKIDQEIEESKGKEKANDIYGLLGLNLTSDQKDAINTSVSYAIDALNQITEARVAAAEAAVQQAQKEVDSAQAALNAELEARANGYAANVQQAQKELDMKKKNQEKAVKEQERAQKQQQSIQAVQQISNMVTASSLIWSQLGFPFAIPAIATMWISFAAAKIKATQLAKKNTETYGDGTVELLSGGSHQSGNDIDLGTKPDGTRRRAEGGEFFAVINKRNSRKFRKIIPSVINSLNDGTFAHKYLNAYSGDEGLNVVLQNDTSDLRELKSDVSEIRRQNETRVYTDANGNVISVYKNLKRTIKQ